MFDSYDVLGIQTIPRSYLEHALKMVGCDNAKRILEERYSEVIAEETINKVSFVFILAEEHKRTGFSYSTAN